MCAGQVAAVVGDGAWVSAASCRRRLGAEQIMLGRHTDRIRLARRFGATDVVSGRGDAAIEQVPRTTGGLGAVLGSGTASRADGREHRALAAPSARQGTQETTIPKARPTFGQHHDRRRPAPVRTPCQLMPDVLEGRIEPGLVFDRITNIGNVPDGYRAMNDREAIKVMIEF